MHRSVQKQVRADINVMPLLFPLTQCRLRYLRSQHMFEFLQIERNFVQNISNSTFYQVEQKELELMFRKAQGRSQAIAVLDEFVDDDTFIVSKEFGPQYYTRCFSFVNKDLLEPGCTVYLNVDDHCNIISGIQTDDVDPNVEGMRVDTKPVDSFEDIGGLSEQIQELKEVVDLPLNHPEKFEDMGIRVPRSVLLFGPSGTGKSLLARAVAHETNATFFHLSGSEMIQSYAGQGPKLVRELFRTARQCEKAIIFIDEVDAVGSQRQDADSGGAREIQRTLLELLNQMDGFVKNEGVVVMLATNRISALDSALLRPGRLDCKIYIPLPNVQARKEIFKIHTRKMTLDGDVNLDEIINAKADMSGADIKAICLEAGLNALRERRMRVTMQDFRSARDKVLFKKQEEIPDFYS